MVPGHREYRYAPFLQRGEALLGDQKGPGLGPVEVEQVARVHDEVRPLLYYPGYHVLEGLVEVPLPLREPVLPESKLRVRKVSESHNIGQCNPALKVMY